MTTAPSKPDPRNLGPQGFSEPDESYAGSRFREVRDALFENPYYGTWGGPGEPPLPVYQVTLRSVLAGLLPFGKPYGFLAAARRTIDSRADLRWGPDGKGSRRLLHPNGVCVTGRWRITEPTDYSGYFRQGSEGLAIARYSTCCTETRRGHTRSLSLVGKVYPTTDPDHTEPLVPASFFTQQDLGGEDSAYINDAVTRNAPDTTATRRGSGLPVFLVTGAVFLKADKEPAHRQLYEIAEIGKPEGEPTRAPEFLRFVVDENQPRIEGDGLDFRDEVLAQIYDEGDPEPKRQLVFHIEVSDDGETKGLPVYQRRTIRGWKRIGSLLCEEAVASYNGDFVVHFHHPAWRDDRNDPATSTRAERS